MGFLDEGEATSSFIAQLSQWDKEELSERLLQRVEFSKRAISKLVAGFDRLLQRNERIASMLKNQLKSPSKKKKSDADSEAKAREESDSDDSANVKKEPLESGNESAEVNIKKELKEETENEPVSVDKAVAEMNIQLVEENRRLQQVASKLQEKNHALSVKVSDFAFSRIDDGFTTISVYFSTAEWKIV